MSPRVTTALRKSAQTLAALAVTILAGTTAATILALAAHGTLTILEGAPQ